jgi:hypothetical protein
MMESKQECFFCGKELSSSSKASHTCIYCSKTEVAENACPDGHFICNSCRAKETWNLIEDYCLKTSSRNPVEIAEILMKSPGFKMHCLDHHFLVPSVLLAAYCKTSKKGRKLKGWLQVAKNRAEKVPGGFCGTHGSCGAAVGTGIFMSTVSGATPLSSIEWDLCNSVVGNSLLSMAKYGGPRCCKRVTYISLIETAAFLKERMSIILDLPDKIKCQFSHLNEQQCLKDKCPFYPN